MKKIIIVLLSLFCISLISTTLISTPTAQAVSYYNWIKGSDMETSTNYCEDGSFESGAWSSGVTYGNWSLISGTASFSSVQVHSGVYSVLCSSTTPNVRYNFTTPVLGADIDAFRYWGYAYGAGTGYMSIIVYYSDGTTTTNTTIPTGTLDEWHEHILVSGVNWNPLKYIVAFEYESLTGYSSYIDDFFFGVIDQYSQEQYDFNTYPWRTTGIAQAWQQTGYWTFGIFGYIPFLPQGDIPLGGLVDVNYIGHNLVYGHESNGSGYIGYVESTAQFIQDIDYLDSDSVHYIDLWAERLDDTVGIGVKINIIYSDRTFSTKTMNITESNDVWEYLNFGSAWIDENKYIIQIQISLANVYNNFVGVDDIGIWSSLPSNQHRFTYTILPTAISQTFIGFNAYQGQQYTFTGYLWDNEGQLSENGTVIIAHDRGATTATLSSGIFTFTIASRTGTSNYMESFAISINTGEVIEVFELTCDWIYTGTDDDGSSQEDRADNILDWIVMFSIIFLPAILFASGIYENNQQPDAVHISPIFGLIGGLILSVGIGVYTNLVPLWMILIVISAVVVLIIGMFKK